MIRVHNIKSLFIMYYELFDNDDSLSDDSITSTITDPDFKYPNACRLVPQCWERDIIEAHTSL